MPNSLHLYIPDNETNRAVTKITLYSPNEESNRSAGFVSLRTKIFKASLQNLYGHLLSSHHVRY
jgi:hypothetical protein